MFDVHRSLVSFVTALVLSSVSGPVLAQRAGTLPARVEAVHDLATFRAAAQRLDMEALPAGTRVGPTLVLPGLGLQFPDGTAGEVWIDLAPRRDDVAVGCALKNFGAGGHTLRTPPDGDADSFLLRVAFAAPVTRAALQVRCVGEEHANLVLSAWSTGDRVGSAFFDLDTSFQVVGLESGRPFDELRLAYTNPSRGTFSLDELVYDLDLSDGDRDRVLDFVDLCPGERDTLQLDSDGDGRGDACDPFPLDALDDADADGLGADIDVCPTLYDPEQLDSDADGLGDACDTVPLGPDSDGDGIADGLDNCPGVANPDQEDCDGDGDGDVCDSTLISPAEVNLLLRRGESVTIEKHICLPPTPPKVDFLLAVDCTGSMGGEIALTRQHVIQFAEDVIAGAPGSDIAFGLVSYRDYPRGYTSCGYSGSYGGGGDWAFRVEAPIGAPPLQFLNAVNSLVASGGSDGPESYTRLLWELSRPDSGIGFRPGARRVVMNFCDDVPHDCNVYEGFLDCTYPVRSTGRDPGRDEDVNTADDIDLQQDALLGLLGTDTWVFTLYSGVASDFCAWQEWCGRTGGVAVQGNSNGQLPAGVNLADLVLNLVGDPFVEEVRLVANASCELEVTFDPPVSGPYDVTHGAEVVVQETITVPADLPVTSGTIDCTVFVAADQVLVGVQQIHIDIGCSTVAFEGPVNGQGISSEFGPLVAISSSGANAGAAVFDSTPLGPNDPSQDDDLLVGRGNVLILQNDQAAAQSLPGVFDRPNDDQDGGDLVFDFSVPVEPASVVLVDIDAGAGQAARVILSDGDGRTRTYEVPAQWTGDLASDGTPGWRTLDLATLAPQPGFASVATASEQAGFQLVDVTRIRVHLGSSGAVDDLVFCR